MGGGKKKKTTKKNKKKKNENGRKREFATDPRSKRAQEKIRRSGTSLTPTNTFHVFCVLFNLFYIFLFIGVRGVPERRIFFLGAFGTGVGCEFPFPSALLLRRRPPPPHWAKGFYRILKDPTGF